MEFDKTLQIRLDEDTVAAVKQSAESQNKNVSTYIRDLLKSSRSFDCELTLSNIDDFNRHSEAALNFFGTSGTKVRTKDIGLRFPVFLYNVPNAPSCLYVKVPTLKVIVLASGLIQEVMDAVTSSVESVSQFLSVALSPPALSEQLSGIYCPEIYACASTLLENRKNVEQVSERLALNGLACEIASYYLLRRIPVKVFTIDGIEFVETI